MFSDFAWPSDFDRLESPRPPEARSIGDAEDALCRVERSPNGAEWSSRAEVFPTASGSIQFVDRQVTPGEVIYYRLAAQVAGAWVRSEEIRVQVPGASEFGLIGFSPNPSNGEVRVAFRLGGFEPVTIELIDVSGRRVGSRRIEAPVAGEDAVDFAGERLSPGLYFVRLTQGNRSAVRRGIVVP